MTARELLQIYVASRILRPNSVLALAQCVGHYGPDRPLTADSLTSYVRSRLADGCSPHTVRAELVRLRGLWKYGHAIGKMPPLTHIPAPRAPKIIVRTTPEPEVARLFRHCCRLPNPLRHPGTRPIPANVYWPAFVVTAYDTGLRTSDMLQMRWEAGKAEWLLHQVKTANPKTVRPHPETLEWLERLARVSPQLFYLGWYRTSYCACLRRLARQIKVEITPQQLRRTSISEVERAHPGAGPWHAGHTNDGTCRRWYFDHSHIWGDVRGPRLAECERDRRPRRRGTG